MSIPINSYQDVINTVTTLSNVFINFPAYPQADAYIKAAIAAIKAFTATPQSTAAERNAINQMVFKSGPYDTIEGVWGGINGGSYFDIIMQNDFRDIVNIALMVLKQVAPPNKKKGKAA